MLRIAGLHVNYGPVEAVKNVDINVEAGEVVCLLGANGAGKTSTLRAISQLIKYDGEIEFKGASLRGKQPEKVARLGLLHVPEGRRVFADLTVQENLQMGVTARSKRLDGWSLSEIYELFPPLDRLRGRSGHVLSGGEQQMVAIGRALAGAPKLLLLDEPSLGLAPSVAHDVFAALGEVKSRCPILLVEQDTARALSIADRAYVLLGGEVVASGAADEMKDRDALLRSYLGGTVEPPGIGVEPVNRAVEAASESSDDAKQGGADVRS
jgi:branched-chain amino acid transport system ATP-binding protein